MEAGDVKGEKNQSARWHEFWKGWWSKKLQFKAKETINWANDRSNDIF